MGGFIGSILLGAIADGSECADAATAPGYCVNPGTITRSGEQLGKQLVATIFCAVYSFVVTYVLLKAIDLVIPVRPQVEGALDLHEHGETAYNHTPTKAYVPEVKDEAKPAIAEVNV
mmetsp:Transcript_92816/g.268022  ORF Transcript_92816/g.268022 Transcript_92816/m.268022 type:complete len:117 (-) Transcript_92816:515-865(-)